MPDAYAKLMERIRDTGRLRVHIHCHGQRYRANELVMLITGKPLSIEPFMNYVTKKFSAVYGL